MFEEDREQYLVGFIASFLGHTIFILILIFGVSGKLSDFGAPIVYSITLEGGKSLGGVSQVPKDDKKTPIAPPKNVSEEKKEEVKKEDAAEVSLPDKDKKEKKKEVEKTKVEQKNDPKSKPKDDKKSKELSKSELEKQFQARAQRYLGESSQASGKGFGAGAIGGQGMGGGKVMPPEFFIYKRLLEEKIKGNWNWFDKESPLVAQIIFDISPDGQISGVRVDRGSGNSSFDGSTLSALQRANPLPPPPPSVYQYFKTVRMTFDPHELG